MSFFARAAKGIGRLFQPVGKAVGNPTHAISERPALPAGENIPACPSCGGALLKMPQRKTKCKHCGEFMYVRSSPVESRKSLVTQRQADAIDAAWTVRAEEYESQREGEIYGLPSLPKSKEVRRSFNLLKVEEDLEKFARQGFVKAQIHGGDVERCDACKRQIGKIVTVCGGAQQVVPVDCKRLNEGGPICSLMVTAAIRRPDGTTWFDRG